MFKFLKKQNNAVYSPVQGISIPLEKVKDQVFSTKLMGDGCAIIPTSNTICAPVDGKLILVADTAHAFGIQMQNGAEILVHIGLDTVALKGKGFQILQQVGAIVKRGDPIISFQADYLINDTLDMTTMVIHTNHLTTFTQQYFGEVTTTTILFKLNV